MGAEHTITAQANTCVLLAPESIGVGKHVTDAVRAGGWTLKRTECPVDAMVTLCRLEAAQRDVSRAAAAKHMLLIHQDIDRADMASLSATVRKHMPAVRIHEVQAPPGEKRGKASGVVGRIGQSVSAAELAGRDMQRPSDARDQDVRDDDERDDADEQAVDERPPHEVTRDEIAMLLSDEAGLDPRPGTRPLPGAGAGAEDGR